MIRVSVGPCAFCQSALYTLVQWPTDTPGEPEFLGTDDECRCRAEGRYSRAAERALHSRAIVRALETSLLTP